MGGRRTPACMFAAGRDVSHRERFAFGPCQCAETASSLLLMMMMMMDAALLRLQIIERLDTVRVDKRGIPIEVALTQDMHHLGVARCVAWGVGQPLQHGGSPTCWMVQELCDKHTLVVRAGTRAPRCSGIAAMSRCGLAWRPWAQPLPQGAHAAALPCCCSLVCPPPALQDAVVKGWFRTSREPTHGGTHLRVVALTAYEVASAVAYLHSHGIAHLVRALKDTLAGSQLADWPCSLGWTRMLQAGCRAAQSNGVHCCSPNHPHPLARLPACCATAP